MDLILHVIIIATVISFTIRVCLWLMRTFFFRSKALERAAPPGDKNWAIVTGCTSGIGEGFAEELAARGLNVVLVSRNPKKLHEIRQRIESQFNVACEIVVIDFSRESAQGYMVRLSDTLGKTIQGNISILVNNVGVYWKDAPNKFLEVAMDEQQDIIQVNLEATMNVTRVVLPLMMQQRRGIVVNIGSAVSVFPCPLLAVYSGSKAFIEAWSAALSEEYKAYGIDIMTICPMAVVSQMSGPKKPSLAMCSARRIAVDTLNSLGTVFTPVAYSPYFMHAVIMFAMSLIPQRILLGLQHKAFTHVKMRVLKRKEVSINPPH